MAHLTLVENQTMPSKQVAVLLRAKALPNVPGVLRCRRCGSQTCCHVTNGSKRGKRKPSGGTVIHEAVCFDCLKLGLIAPMFWDVQSVPTNSDSAALNQPSQGD